MERKYKALEDVQVEDRKVVGYASVFGGVDSYGDTIIPGAYAKSINAMSGKGLPMLWHHDGDVLIGRWTDLQEDDKGLRVEGVLTPGHSKAEDVYASMKAGHVDGMSIGYTIPKGGAVYRKDGGRDLKAINLMEISITWMPADANALIEAVKAAELQPREFREMMRKAMRDAGYDLSRNEAEAFMAGGYKALKSTRDAGDEQKGALEALVNAIRSAKG